MIRWSAPLVVFAVLLVVLGSLNRNSDPEPGALSADLSAGSPLATYDTEARVEALQSALASEPDNAGLAAQLGAAYYQRARETADPAFYGRSEEAYATALELDPASVDAVTGQATLALARHDFAAGLALAEQARELEPELVAPYAPLVDAQIELGRYAAAERSLDRLLTLKPGLAAYARASYFRELNGDLLGALAAMRLAADAGAGSVESEAYVLALTGKLEIDLGRYDAARDSYKRALALDREYAPALAGLARVDAAAGEFDDAIRRYRRVVEILPLPEYAVALGEVEEAAGRSAAAADSYALVAVEAKLLSSGGVNTDVDLAIFDADHGSPAAAVRLGRTGYQAAPSVRSADAYAWALHSAGRDRAASRLSAEAMRLGSRDPVFLFHAGMIAEAAGDTVLAQRYLGKVVAQSPRFSPLHGPEAKRMLAKLRAEA